jgi:hypothetical protein
MLTVYQLFERIRRTHFRHCTRQCPARNRVPSLQEMVPYFSKTGLGRRLFFSNYCSFCPQRAVIGVHPTAFFFAIEVTVVCTSQHVRSI